MTGSPQAICLTSKGGAHMRVLIAAAFAIGVCSTAMAEPSGLVEFHHGYITGNAYRDMPPVGRQGYVIGVVDGMLTAPAFGAPSGMRSWLGRCLETGIRTDQLK